MSKLVGIIFLKECTTQEFTNTLFFNLIADESQLFDPGNFNEIINILY